VTTMVALVVGLQHRDLVAEEPCRVPELGYSV
jgi:hypothetical protein